MTVSPSSLTVGPLGGQSAEFTITAHPPPTGGALTIPLTPPAFASTSPAGSASLAQGASSVNVTVSGTGSTDQTGALSFGTLSGADAGYNAQSFGATIAVTEVSFGAITVSPSSVSVAQNGASGAQVTVSFNPAPSSPVRIVLTVPASCSVVGGSTLSIPALATTVHFTVLGGSSVTSTSITLGAASSADPKYGGAPASPSSVAINIVAQGLRA